jgi:hypothetical protein
VSEEPTPRVDPPALAPAEASPTTTEAQPIPRKRSVTKAPATQAPDDDALAREMAATAAAKRSLASDPAEALRLVAAADRDFADGVYGEDRDGIAVLALAKLGRKDEARSRGDAYLAAHPKGSYADRIRAVLADL